ncbi:hypothetical protein Trco_001995 [Trichoderma cornu-damae]|uniref:Uncharacterized protein n=1 Tax=Trichoderma cornu-damae TaxID=654480 RepID=A0A9P8TYQ3_9HYPO|nr:hypothetical protein Trco_001995 [Trichoderma cornu-damae]
MLSKGHHMLYWVLSLVSLQAQPLRSVLKDRLAAGNDAQTILDYAIAFYALWFCLFLIEKRTRLPPAPPNWQNQRPVKKKIWERAPMAVVGAAVKKRMWFRELGTALMCLIVGDGALWVSAVGPEDTTRQKTVRVLATFMFLGMAEPLWRDRPDVEVCELEALSRTASRAGVVDTVLSAATTASVLWAVAVTADLAIFFRTGEWVDAAEWWFPVTTRPHRVFVMLWLLSPFTDLAETIFYSVYKR